jgi:hypothetical protein
MYNLIYHINETATVLDAWEQGLKQICQEKLHNKELHNFKTLRHIITTMK